MCVRGLGYLPFKAAVPVLSLNHLCSPCSAVCSAFITVSEPIGEPWHTRALLNTCRDVTQAQWRSVTG